MPARLQEKLMGFQREGIKFALKRGGRLLVGDEMGDYCMCWLLLHLQPEVFLPVAVISVVFKCAPPYSSDAQIADLLSLCSFLLSAGTVATYLFA